MTTNTGLSLSLLAAVLLTSAPALAHHSDKATVSPAAHESGGRTVDEHRPLAADGKLSVSNVAGEVEVFPGDSSEVHVTGTLGEDVEELKITGDASNLRVEVKLPRDTRHGGRTRLRLGVPPRVTLGVDTVSADISVEGLSGPVTVKSVSGDVSVEGSSAKISADSVSGDVRVSGPGAKSTHAQSVSGDVKVEGPGGTVEAESVSGDIVVNAREVKVLNAKTVSGEIKLAADPGTDGEVEAQSMSGEIRLMLPASVSAKVELESFSGDVSSDFGKLDGDEGQRRTQTIGSGKARVRLNSFSGEVELRKR